MYNSKTVNQRITMLLKEKSFNQKQLLENCNLNVNALNQMSDNKGIGCFALARIADRLETTTDYLLGRSDNPNMTITITQGNPTISRTGELSRVTSGNIGNITINSEDTVSEESKEILEMIESLSAVQKAKVILMIDEMKKDNKNEN